MPKGNRLTVADGRQVARGSALPQTKLSSADVGLIKGIHKAFPYVSGYALGNAFDVDGASVRNVLRGKTHKTVHARHVTLESLNKWADGCEGYKAYAVRRLIHSIVRGITKEL